MRVPILARSGEGLERADTAGPAGDLVRREAEAGHAALFSLVPLTLRALRA